MDLDLNLTKKNSILPSFSLLTLNSILSLQLARSANKTKVLETLWWSIKSPICLVYFIDLKKATNSCANQLNFNSQSIIMTNDRRTGVEGRFILRLSKIHSSHVLVNPLNIHYHYLYTSFHQIINTRSAGFGSFLCGKNDYSQ